MSELTIHSVQKIEVVKIKKLQHEDGKVFYCAKLEIISKQRVSNVELYNWDKKHLTEEGKDAELSGHSNIITELTLFADNKEALEVKLNAFKEDK